MKLTAKQLREMSEIQLQKTLFDLQGELRKLRFLAGHGELKKNHQIRDIKRNLARVKTEFKARELNIKPQPKKSGKLSVTSEKAEEKVASE